jgi:hypothetical protein
MDSFAKMGVAGTPVQPDADMVCFGPIPPQYAVVCAPLGDMLCMPKTLKNINLIRIFGYHLQMALNSRVV